MSNRKLALMLAGCTLAVMFVMLVLSFATGVTQEAHEHYRLPEPYAMSLLDHSAALRALFALDIAFIILYTAFFAAFAACLHELGRPFTRLAFGLMLATALLDFVEDHHIVTMLDAAENRVLPSSTAIYFQVVLSEVKFSTSYLALVMFGLAVPRTTKVGLVLCLFLTMGTLLETIVGYALPLSAQASFDHGRWVGFVAGFGLVIAWLVKTPEPAKT